MHIGKAIKELRTSKGLTQTAFAETLNIGQSRVSEFERRKYVSMQNLFRLAKALGVQPSKLLDLAERQTS